MHRGGCYYVDSPEDPEGSEGSTAKRADSTNDMPAENDDKMTNSDEYDAQNEQNSTHFDANCTQKEVTDISAHSIKPSGPSVIYVGNQNPTTNPLKNSNVSSVINFA